MKNFLIVLLAAACVVLALRGCGRQGERITIRTDTVTVVRVDTVHYTDVQYRERVRVRVDTIVEVATGDTSTGDTIRVPVPIDRYTFTDDTTYRAIVSGYGVTLDRMDVFRRTVERTITVERTVVGKPKRWGLGIQVGYGITLDGGGRITPRPYIGIGLSYNFLRF